MTNSYSMSRLLRETDTTTVVLNYIIKTKHKYLLLINHERDARVLIETTNYSYVEEHDHVYYIHTKKPVWINGESLIMVFEIDISSGDDVIGFHTAEEAYAYCKEHSINTAKKLDSKIIFSPQLANYLLDKGFRIIHLKQHSEDIRQTVFVFCVEDGFYNAISEYRNNQSL